MKILEHHNFDLVSLSLGGDVRSNECTSSLYFNDRNLPHLSKDANVDWVQLKMEADAPAGAFGAGFLLRQLCTGTNGTLGILLLRGL